MNRIEHAARLCEHYWPLIIRPNSKAPVDAFRNKAPPDVDRVIWELRRNPTLNIAIRLPWLVALDADDEPAKAIIRQHETPFIQATPSGGEHRLFRLPEGITANCRTRIGGIGLDLKTGQNSYLMMDFSRIDGIRYQLSDLVGPHDLPELDVTPFRREEPPIEPKPKNHPPDYARTLAWAADVLYREYFSFEHAGGDLGLFKAACFLIQRARLRPEDARDLLRQWNQSANVDVPWPDSRLAYKLREAERLRR